MSKPKSNPTPSPEPTPVKSIEILRRSGVRGIAKQYLDDVGPVAPGIAKYALSLGEDCAVNAQSALDAFFNGHEVEAAEIADRIEEIAEACNLIAHTYQRVAIALTCNPGRLKRVRPNNGWGQDTFVRVFD